MKGIALADGGDGFLKALIEPMNLQIERETVIGNSTKYNYHLIINHAGPLGDPVEAEYGLNQDSKIAVIEMVSSFIPSSLTNPGHSLRFATCSKRLFFLSQ